MAEPDEQLRVYEDGAQSLWIEEGKRVVVKCCKACRQLMNSRISGWIDGVARRLHTLKRWFSNLHGYMITSFGVSIKCGREQVPDREVDDLDFKHPIFRVISLRCSVLAIDTEFKAYV